jgi:hypothetical protein
MIKNEFPSVAVGQDNWIERILYKLLAPPPPPDLEAATFAIREQWRRGRSVALALVCHITIIGAVLPVVLSGAQPALQPLIPLYVLLWIVAIFLNRRGNYRSAGTICVVSFELLVIIDVWTLPQGLDLFYLPMFDVILQAGLIAVSVFGTRGAMLICAGNIAFVAITLLFAPHTQAVEQMFASGLGYDAFLRPASLHFMATVIMLVAMRSMRQAFLQVDKAGEEVRFRRHMAQVDKELREQRQKVEEEIMVITDALAQFAKGDRQTRIPLTPGMLLWTLAGHINSALTRMAHLEREALPAIQTHSDMQSLLKIAQQQRRMRRPFSSEQIPPDLKSETVQAFLQEIRRMESSNNLQL